MTEQILGFLGLMRRAEALAVGAERAFDASREGKTRLLAVAQDAAKNTVSAMYNARGEKETPLITLDCTKQELGQALGVGECAAFAVLDTGFALALCKKLGNGELIPLFEERLAREKKRKQKKLQKKETPAPKSGESGGAVRRIAEKRARKTGGNGPARAAGPAEGRKQSPRARKPRVTGKRGN